MHKTITILIFLASYSLLMAQTMSNSEIWEEGIFFIKAGDYLRGKERMDQYLVKSPYNPNALHNRALCLKNLGDESGSCRDYSDAMAVGYKENKKLIEYSCNPDFKLNLLKKRYYKDVELYPEFGNRPRYNHCDTLRGALRPERSCFDVYFYNLSVKINPVSKTIEGRNDIWFKGVAESSEIQVDLFDNYKISKIRMDSASLNFRRECNAIFIRIPGSVQPGMNYKITIEYSGKPRKAPDPPWDGGFVWSRDKRLHRWVGVACEQLGASSWWPNKDHLSDKPDSMAINIEVPKRYKAICNGRLRNVVHTDKKYDRYEWFVDYPINNYNATFYMGKFVELTDTLIRPHGSLLLKYYVLPYHRELAIKHFKQSRDVLNFYSDAFGEFPFMKDKYGLVESPYEGMEHQTAIAYGASFNNGKNKWTYLNKSYDFIIVHETAHEWWGNSVTAADMADIWIHEGFATYAEYLFLENQLGYEASIAELHNHLKYIYNVWPIVQNRDVNENSFASSAVYFKGATLLQCLRATMNNDTLFKRILKDFQLKYQYKVVTSNDFIRFVNECTNHDFSPLFNIFLYKTTLPVLEYSYERKGNDLVIKYKWTGVDDGFEMPFSIETIDSLVAYRIMATTQDQEITIPDAASFSFFNISKSPVRCPHNGLTYFETKCKNQQ